MTKKTLVTNLSQSQGTKNGNGRLKEDACGVNGISGSVRLNVMLDRFRPWHIDMRALQYPQTRTRSQIAVSRNRKRSLWVGPINGHFLFWSQASVEVREGEARLEREGGRTPPRRLPVLLWTASPRRIQRPCYHSSRNRCSGTQVGHVDGLIRFEAETRMALCTRSHLECNSKRPVFWTRMPDMCGAQSPRWF
jgi:hypothetical protein